jgi:ANTAR domain
MRDKIAFPACGRGRSRRSCGSSSTPTLEARVVVERGIGILAERFELPVPDAVEVLLSAARHSRRKTWSLAKEITESRKRTPGAITDALRRRAT